MRRALLESAKVTPYTSGDTIDRLGFLSALVGIKVAGTGGTLTLDITHSAEESGSFEAVTDKWVALGDSIKDIPVEADTLYNLNLDLVGLKRYVKITATTAADATYAITLGDPVRSPV